MSLIGEYRFSDFLLFSEEVYWRLFQLHNADFWPLQVPALLGGAAILFCLWRRPGPGDLVVGAVVAFAWGLAAWAYFWVSFQTINWAALYIAPIFALQAVILLAGTAAGALRYRPAGGGARRALGWILLVYGLVLHALTPPLAGRPLAGAEVFGLTPDPTAIATLGLLALTPGGPIVGLALFLPLAWCAFSAATLYAMGTWEAALPSAALALGVLARPWRKVE